MRRISTVATAVVGVILLVHALAMVALALTTGTTTYLALSRPLSLTIVGGGLAALVWWIRRQHGWNRAPGRNAAGPAGSARQHEPGSTLEGDSPSEYTDKDHHAHLDNPENRHHQRTHQRGIAQGPR
jgi:ABC-type nickel/cobalt efflux system permease component RcnA